MRSVFCHWQFTVQMVFTTSSKTVAERSKAPVRHDRQERNTACPLHKSQNSWKSSSARNIQRIVDRMKARSDSVIFGSGIRTWIVSVSSDQRIATCRGPPCGKFTAHRRYSPSSENGAKYAQPWDQAV